MCNRTMGNKTINMSLQHVIENSEFWNPLKKTTKHFGRPWEATEDFGGRRGLAMIMNWTLQLRR